MTIKSMDRTEIPATRPTQIHESRPEAPPHTTELRQAQEPTTTAQLAGLLLTARNFTLSGALTARARRRRVWLALVGWWLVASFGERESLTPLPLIPP